MKDRLESVLDSINSLRREVEELIDDAPDTSTIEDAVPSHVRTAKLAVVVGHTKKSPGAHGVGMPPEYVHNCAMAEDMFLWSKANPGAEVKIFTRDSGGVTEAYRQVDEWGADLAVELHYNAVATSSAKGTLTLSSGSSKSLEFANSVHAKHVAIMKSQDRGVEIRNRTFKDRGWFNLTVGKTPTIIIEPGFGSNPDEAQKMLLRRSDIGIACVVAAIEVVNGW